MSAQVTKQAPRSPSSWASPRRVLFALALLALGYVVGTLAPHAHAGDPTQGIVAELRGIKSELTNIRRELEKRTR